MKQKMKFKKLQMEKALIDEKKHYYLWKDVYFNNLYDLFECFKFNFKEILSINKIDFSNIDLFNIFCEFIYDNSSQEINNWDLIQYEQ